MTTFVKSTEIAVTTPIFATDNAWNGINSFNGSTELSYANVTRDATIVGNVAVNGFATLGSTTATDLTVGNVVVNGSATLGPTTATGLTVTGNSNVLGHIGLKSNNSIYMTDVVGGYNTSVTSYCRMFTITGVVYVDFKGSVAWRATTAIGNVTKTCMTLGSNGDLTIGGNLTIPGSLVTNGLMYEATRSISGTTNAYSFDYAAGGVYYLPSGINPSANSTLTVTNIPSSVGQSYTFTVVSYQASTRYYISQVKMQDTDLVYILGSSGAFAVPLFNGGTPFLSGVTACVIVQQFTVFPMNGSRYVMSSVSACS